MSVFFFFRVVCDSCIEIQLGIGKLDKRKLQSFR